MLNLLNICWLFSYLSGEAVRFNSVVTALAVMYAAEKYLVNRINSLALKFINKNANSDNVLMILQHLYVLHQKETEDEEVYYAPSAPPLELFDPDLVASSGSSSSSSNNNNNNNRSDVDKERHHESHKNMTSHSMLFVSPRKMIIFISGVTLENNFKSPLICKGLIGDAIVSFSIARQWLVIALK